MKKVLKTTVACMLLCAMFVGGGTFSALAAQTSTSQFPSETNSFVSNFLIDQTDQDAPFFEVILPQIAANIEENNKHSISPYYDKLPEANNPENFQGLGSTSYANINGKTVYAEAFYRLHDESLHDPNYGLGLLIYQCIQYKLKHPDEEVTIGYSSYRTSATASVCVIPESKYYGYMRSLYGTNYDEHGFVRVSYMLVEAARMGINVTMINQLPSYAVLQYDPQANKLRSRAQIDFKQYFKAALKTSCYDKYVGEGKKVSDYLSFTTVEWTVGDQTENMQHMKSAIVSHYLATDGTEYSPGIFVSSANFDENNYKGANGNNNSQSGAIVSNHDDLFRVMYNYMKLMEKYSYKEGLQELRRIMTKANEEQIALIQSGRGDEIPPDEQLVYIGTETDPIFEMYFTPIGGSQDAWDPIHNPVCKHMNNFAASTDYVEFVWIHTEYARPYTGTIIEKILIDKYCNEPNVKNKIVTKTSKLQINPIKALEVGTEIGYKDIKGGDKTHSKDMMMSYEQDGVRHYVSIMTSCNFYMIAFNLRTNSILVINETDETGNGFYKAFGSRYAYGMLDTYEDDDDNSTNEGGTGESTPSQGGNNSTGGSSSSQGGNNSTGGSSSSQDGNNSTEESSPSQGESGSTGDSSSPDGEGGSTGDSSSPDGEGSTTGDSSSPDGESGSTGGSSSSGNEDESTGSSTDPNKENTCSHVDKDENNICDKCGKQMSAKKPIYSNPIFLICIITGGVLAIGGAVFWIIKRKKKLNVSSDASKE